MILACREQESTQTNLTTKSKPMDLNEVASVQQVVQWVKKLVPSSRDLVFGEEVDRVVREAQLSQSLSDMTTGDKLNKEVGAALEAVQAQLFADLTYKELKIKSERYKDHDNLIRIANVIHRIGSSAPIPEDVKKAYELLLEEVKTKYQKPGPLAQNYEILYHAMQNLYAKQLIIEAAQDKVSVVKENPLQATQERAHPPKKIPLGKFITTAFKKSC